MQPNIVAHAGPCAGSPPLHVNEQGPCAGSPPLHVNNQGPCAGSPPLRKMVGPAVRQSRISDGYRPIKSVHSYLRCEIIQCFGQVVCRFLPIRSFVFPSVTSIYFDSIPYVVRSSLSLKGMLYFQYIATPPYLL